MAMKNVLLILAALLVFAGQAVAIDGLINVYSFPAGMTAKVTGIDVPGVSMVQTTPNVFSVPYGRYKVEVYGNQFVSQTYLPVNYTVLAEHRRPVTIRAKPVPVTGDIRILAPQYTSISVSRIGGPLNDSHGVPYAGDYAYDGSTGSGQRRDIARFHEGTYVIKAVKSGYVPMEKTLKVDAGRSNIIIFNLQKAR